MEVVNLTQKQFSSLSRLKLAQEISNDEATIYILNKGPWRYAGLKYLFKAFKTVDKEYFANKLFNISILNNYEKKLNIDSLVIPKYYGAVNNQVKGVIIPRVLNSRNLGLILNNTKIDKKEKIKYLKSVGELISKVQKQNILPFVFGDLHPYNFLIGNEDDKLYVIDLDSAYFNTNYPPGAHYLYTNKAIAHFPTKYEVNVYGITIPTKDTDILCYQFMLLNTLAGFGSKFKDEISSLNIEDYFNYITYLESLGYGKNIIEAFRSVYSNGENINPTEYLDEIPKDMLGRSSYKVYQEVINR